MGLVRHRIEASGERLWRLEDFRDLPFAAVAQSLSRLTREGILERISKGVYYSARPTTFGKSLPSPAAIQKLASRRKTVFPSGIAAANLLGFTTQTARRSEVSTSALSLPRKLIGTETVVHTRRPEAWASLSETDAALLDFLRRGARPVNSRQQKPSPEPWRCCLKEAASSVSSEWPTRSRHGCARSLAPSASSSERSLPRFGGCGLHSIHFPSTTSHF
jgi:hypothetical protein